MGSAWEATHWELLVIQALPAKEGVGGGWPRPTPNLPASVPLDLFCSGYFLLVFMSFTSDLDLTKGRLFF